jgi:DNA primase
LFTSKFTKAGRKVILLLDGVDEAGDDAIKRIIDIIKNLSRTKANIQIMFSTDAAVSDELGFGQIEATKFMLDKKIVAEDMKLVAMARMKRLSRLSKLRLPTRKKIARKLCGKADSKYHLLFLIFKVYFMVALSSTVN